MKTANLISGKPLDMMPSEEVCRKHFEQMRWNGEITCVYCNHGKVYNLTKYKRYKCAKCKKQFSLLHGTIFKHSKLSFRQWILAIQTMNQSIGISSYKLAVIIETTSDNALYVQRRIRKAMDNNPEFRRQMKGWVEIDETFVGGKNKNRHWDKKVKGCQGKGSMKDKASIVGFIERATGFVRLFHFRKFKKGSFQAIIRAIVKKGETISTDEYEMYPGLDKDYKHGCCNHSQKKYVDGENHTNTIEGFWRKLKTTITSIHIQVSREYLIDYCREIAFRHNTRKMAFQERFSMILSQFVLPV